MKFYKSNWPFGNETEDLEREQRRMEYEEHMCDIEMEDKLYDETNDDDIKINNQRTSS